LLLAVNGTLRQIKATICRTGSFGGLMPPLLPGETAPDRTVLVVDDDPAVRNSLQFSLEIDGYRVRLFHSDRDVLELGELPPSACLVIDYNLPGTNGLDLLAAMRARGYASPAILITSHPPAGVRRRAAAAGVPIVEKPLLGDALIDAIHAAVRSR
jgi:FixJ family two-component response regulator